VYTILPIQLANIVEHFYQPLLGSPLSVAAQSESAVPLVVGALVLVLVVVLVLFWRMSRKPHVETAAPAEHVGATPTPTPTVTPPPPTVITLDFAAESKQTMSVILDKPALTLGRASDNDIVLTTPVLNYDTVSQHHARLRRDPDGYVVRDLGSKNGVTVNGRQTLENLLQDGDRVCFGEVEAIFHQPAGGAA
jgi:hypothetical protein